MDERDPVIRPDEIHEEAGKAHRTIWVGEGLLWRAHDAAQRARELAKGVDETPLPQADDETRAEGGHDAE